MCNLVFLGSPTTSDIRPGSHLCLIASNLVWFRNKTNHTYVMYSSTALIWFTLIIAASSGDDQLYRHFLRSWDQVTVKSVFNQSFISALYQVTRGNFHILSTLSYLQRWHSSSESEEEILGASDWHNTVCPSPPLSLSLLNLLWNVNLHPSSYSTPTPSLPPASFLILSPSGEIEPSLFYSRDSLLSPSGEF